MANMGIADDRIVRAAIHPAIGVARVGNSKGGYFVGPQVINPPVEPPGFYRDASGALKRQVALFRIYGYNQAGEVVRELTADIDEIRWSAHLANRKAAWYQWAIALDVPEAIKTELSVRNPDSIGPNSRARLVVDGRLQEVVGAGAAAVSFIGKFEDQPVYLGEISTDAAGRLLVFGGHGVSESPSGSPVFDGKAANPFGNSDGWFDDIADGPVTAQVRIDGREIEVERAWVLTAPPNYAPAIKGIRTLYDLLFEMNVDAGWQKAPAPVSFTKDVYPIFKRLADHQWVNQAFAVQFGHNGFFDFGDPSVIEYLAARPASLPSKDANREFRRIIFNSFRPPEPVDGNQLPWPWLYGDAMEVPASQTPRQNCAITRIQYEALRHWASGDFEADWGQVASPRSIEEVPLALQPAMLDRAALDFCLADGFHPGCEVTWPIRHLSIYSGPFRIRHGVATPADPPADSKLDQATALAEQGPLQEQGPGTLTRWMAVPWQADTAWCRSGYDKKYDEFAPTFWPARVPNHVLAEQEYAKAMDQNALPADRINAFSIRTDWNSPLDGSVPKDQRTKHAMEEMLRIFGSMGLLEEREGLVGDAIVPPRVLVASFGPDIAPSRQAGEAAAGAVPKSSRSLTRGPNYISPEAARSAPLSLKKVPE
jgi:L-Lysine epsilon oxidase N-terminal/L-lysine epsilon oxidase C-terminal domain